MTQLLHLHKNNNMPTEKRAFTGTALTTNRQVNGSNSQVSQKIKSFFRINSSGPKDSFNIGKSSNEKDDSGSSTPRGLRQSRFMPHIGRNRSQTVASEGDTLDQGMSPTAHANPYFQHQGPPALRHHNDSSVPPSPSSTPSADKENDAEVKSDAETSNGKEDLARKLRRVASAPNAQGLFTKDGEKNRPQTPTENTTVKIGEHTNRSASALTIDTGVNGDGALLPVPTLSGSPGQLRDSVAFRRTYSSNSIKVRNVEVGPGSFDKIKLIGKGDVGKVYLVREKKSARLYAMKGERRTHPTISSER